MGLIDSHAHLTFPELAGRLDAVLSRCAEAGVDAVITVGTDADDGRRAVELAERHPKRIYAAVALHPHEAERATEDHLQAVSRLWDHHSVVAIGEIGLDYHYDFADRATQRSVLARQLDSAVSRAKPLIIHCRDAFDDLIPLLLDHGFRGKPAVFHCFTGGEEEAFRVAEHGWRISFTGIVTFPKSTRLQAVAEAYPTEALMIETDSPFLSPVPVRGEKPNEPANVTHIARFLARLRDVDYDRLVELTAANTRKFFNI